MNLVKASFEFRTPFGQLTPEVGLQMLRFIEWNARISHASEDKQTDDSWKRFIQAVVIEHGDLSVIEHATLTAVLRIDRAICMELVRHRLFSYTMASTRFINYSKHDMEFIGSEVSPLNGQQEWNDSVARAEWTYLDLLKKGWPPQYARSVLPNALAATISCTGNIRNFRHLMLMRTSRETHMDFKAVTVPMLAELQRCIPLLFADIEPHARQVDNLKKPR
jgi:thymidylate synthase (FAD)